MAVPEGDAEAAGGPGVKACDICQAQCAHLEQLLESYRTSEISEVCPSCADVINKQVRKVQRATSNILFTLMKRFMARMRAERTGQQEATS
jgi:hypothetical protein